MYYYIAMSAKKELLFHPQVRCTVMYVYGSNNGMHHYWLESELRSHLEEEEAAP